MARDEALMLAVAITTIFLAGCQSTVVPVPAVLSNADEPALSELRSVLARAMNDASVEIGPGDLTRTSTVTALPRRLNPNEDRSLARPVQFDLVVEGERCFLIRRDTGEEFALTGVACRPAP